MKKKVILAILLLAFGTSLCSAAPQKGDQKATVASVYGKLVTGVTKEVTSAAEAMPEDKFNFAPTQGEFKGVRTYAQQLKHIAAVNYIFGSTILGEKPPMELGGENGPDNVTSKADVLKFLNGSFDYLQKALATLNEGNVMAEVQSPFGPSKITKLQVSVMAIAHPMDHYGQMVEYLRMNGIVPPASRQ